jgi:hypothetical protein
VSRRTPAKQARRKKRRAAGGARWIPEGVLDELSDDIELAADLERFDERITERGWMFDDELSDDESAIWFYPPSGAEVGDEKLQPVTTVFISVADGGEFVHLVLVGTAEDYQFTSGEVFDHIEVIESYRLGAPRSALN